MLLGRCERTASRALVVFVFDETRGEDLEGVASLETDKIAADRGPSLVGFDFGFTRLPRGETTPRGRPQGRPRGVVVAAWRP